MGAERPKRCLSGLGGRLDGLGVSNIFWRAAEYGLHSGSGCGFRFSNFYAHRRRREEEEETNVCVCLSLSPIPIHVIDVTNDHSTCFLIFY